MTDNERLVPSGRVGEGEGEGSLWLAAAGRGRE